MPRRRTQLPTWLMALLFAALFIAVGGGIFWLTSRGNASHIATLETPAAKAGGPNPLQKLIEVTGMRFGESSKELTVTFLVINHSPDDLVNLAGNVTLTTRTDKSDATPVGTFTFQLAMPANTSKELTMPLTTKMKLVALPDWQNIKADVQITSPAGA